MPLIDPRSTWYIGSMILVTVVYFIALVVALRLTPASNSVEDVASYATKRKTAWIIAGITLPLTIAMAWYWWYDRRSTQQMQGFSELP